MDTFCMFHVVPEEFMGTLSCLLSWFQENVGISSHGGFDGHVDPAKDRWDLPHFGKVSLLY